MEYAAATLAWALETIGGAKYGFIGGSAISIIARQYDLPGRQTEDLDLIVQPTTMSADLLSNRLTTDESVRKHFMSKKDGYVDKPHVVVARADEVMIYIPIEIFDWQVWPNRERYYNLDWTEIKPCYLPVDNRRALFLTPGWLLRQKILSYMGRGGMKKQSDLEDIESLGRVLALRRETIIIREEGEVEALKVGLRADDAPELQEFVRCEAV
ncbi:MAG: hypothetical protein M1818_003709 [Claussenomyces sp. TS43310]|nr:MAG: hypothetical protein M1818_003709 [Claussenomyces sp. TS43310]